MAFPRLQRFFELFLLADIEKNSAEMPRRPGLVLDQAGARPDPLAAAVRPAHLEGDVETAAAPYRRAFDITLGALAVLRLEQREKVLITDRLTAGDAEQAPRRVGPFQFKRCEIQIPRANAEPLDSQPEMLMSAGCIGGRLNDAGHA